MVHYTAAPCWLIEDQPTGGGFPVPDAAILIQGANRSTLQKATTIPGEHKGSEGIEFRSREDWTGIAEGVSENAAGLPRPAVTVPDTSTWEEH